MGGRYIMIIFSHMSYYCLSVVWFYLYEESHEKYNITLCWPPN